MDTPQLQPLWPADEHGSDASPVDRPTLTLYHPVGETLGGCVMVCPGGGYGTLADHEGEPVAQWLNRQGFHAAVLRYRHGPDNRHPRPTLDAQRGLRLLRANAEAWGFRPDAVAVLGFSAGGHLASTLAVHYDDFHCAADDLAGHISARPDAAVLCYPVIDMAGPFTHRGSRSNFLGSDLPPDLLDLMSTERHVTAQTPPCFLWHTADDEPVPVENSLQFVAACRKQKVPVELHVYESGRHGLGLADEQPDIATWKDHAAAFLMRHLIPQDDSRPTQ